MVFLGFSGHFSIAAQMGKVVTDQAPLFEFPQKGSRVIGKVRKGLGYPVSNLPTEGYYKLRTNSGEYGWISGNDILVEGGKVEAYQKDIDGGSSPEPAAKEKTEAPSPESEWWGDRTRIQLGMGAHALSYGGISDYISGTSALNFGSQYSLEIQRKFFYLIYGAVRVQMMSADTGSVQISNSGTKQRIQQHGIPIELGLILHPIHARKFRIGFGGYAGASVGTWTTVQTITSTQDQTVKYSSLDPIGTASVQITYGLSKALALFLDLSARYHVTGEQAATVQNSVNIPSFKINYSGYYASGGLELRF
ncbi:MAG: hypothetical protein EBX52_00510 [Proteobacteria bacterium]|nr:hypothetical protein [Pseudomonadota bacterium]